MITANQVGEVIGSTAYTHDGNKLGKVGQVFLDDATGEPEFATVNTGLFGTSESYVPLAQATYDGDRLTVPHSKDQVKDAPNVELDGGHLDQAEEQRLYEHYGLTHGHTAPPTGTGTGTGTDVGTHDAGTGTGTGQEGHATGTGTGTGTDDAMTRSEEHVEVGTTTEQAGRARLRKYVTTETETRTVPVRKEHAVLETEPITEGDVGAATDGPTISEAEHEVVLHEERPVVETVAEPVERVRLGTQTEVDEETVSADVRKEHVELDDDGTTGTTGTAGTAGTDRR